VPTHRRPVGARASETSSFGDSRPSNSSTTEGAHHYYDDHDTSVGDFDREFLSLSFRRHNHPATARTLIPTALRFNSRPRGGVDDGGSISSRYTSASGEVAVLTRSRRSGTGTQRER
jgi:hypothetical protein